MILNNGHDFNLPGWNINMKPYTAWVVALFALSTIWGCGTGGDAPPLGKVVGIVLVDGKPKGDLIVTFTPLDGGRSSTGTTDADGSYALVYSSTALGAMVGKHSVTIAPNSTYTDEEINNPGLDLTKPKGSLPKGYDEIKKEVEIQKGSNTIELAFP